MEDGVKGVPRVLSFVLTSLLSGGLHQGDTRLHDRPSGVGRESREPSVPAERWTVWVGPWVSGRDPVWEPGPPHAGRRGSTKPERMSPASGKPFEDLNSVDPSQVET